MLIFTYSASHAQQYQEELTHLLSHSITPAKNWHLKSSPHAIVWTLSDNVLIGTFPAICLTILKSENIIPQGTTIMEAAYQKEFVKETLKKREKEKESDRDEVLGYMVENALNSINIFKSNPSRKMSEKFDDKLYLEYELFKKKNNYIDQSDMVSYLTSAFQNQPTLLEKYQKK